MFSKIAIASLIASVVSAATNFTTTTDSNGLTWVGNSTLPKILIFATGGTILSASNYSRLDNVYYGSGPSPSVLDLLTASPEILTKAQVSIITFAAPGGSSGINSSLFLNVSQYANRYLCDERYGISGAVMTHGTNTLEETIFGIDVTYNCPKPVIAFGAMRPNTNLSPDGPANFYQAVAAAVDPQSRNRGALIVFNDRIVSAFYASKTHANSPDTFKAMEQGFVGYFMAGQSLYYGTPSLPYNKPYFNATRVNATSLGQVTIVYGHQGNDDSMMLSAVNYGGAKGIVFMGAGAGQLSPGSAVNARALIAKGVPVVVALRPFSGTAPPPIQPGIIYSVALTSSHARIVLQLAMATGMDIAGIRDVFEGYYRKQVFNDATAFYDSARY